MIENRDIPEFNPEQEETDEESGYLDDSKYVIQNEIVKGYALLDELRGFNKSGVGVLVNNELEDEYQRIFAEVLKSTDPIDTHTKVQQMKSIGFAMGIIKNQTILLEDDLKNLKKELDYQEAGEKL